MKLAVFLFASALMMLVSGLYFEYMLNRECSIYLSSAVGIVLVVILVYYIKYVVKTVQKFLNI
jgi:hypothetical protein